MMGIKPKIIVSKVVKIVRTGIKIIILLIKRKKIKIKGIVRIKAKIRYSRL